MGTSFFGSLFGNDVTVAVGTVIESQTFVWKRAGLSTMMETRVGCRKRRGWTIVTVTAAMLAGR